MSVLKDHTVQCTQAVKSIISDNIQWMHVREITQSAKAVYEKIASLKGAQMSPKNLPHPKVSQKQFQRKIVPLKDFFYFFSGDNFKFTLTISNTALLPNHFAKPSFQTSQLATTYSTVWDSKETCPCADCVINKDSPCPFG